MNVEKEIITNLIAGIKNDEQRRKVIQKEIRNGGIDEGDVADILVKDIENNLEKYQKHFESNPEAQLIWSRFYDQPEYLARALVRLIPELFYIYGFTYRVVCKLRAKLGNIIIPKGGEKKDEDFGKYMKELPKDVKADIYNLDFDRAFREYLYLFSRDVEVGFEIIGSAIEQSSSEYEKDLLKNVGEYYQKLLDMQFPDFISDIEGSLFPSIHVRWWINVTAKEKRVLNIGDTGTQKTAYGVVAAHMNTDGQVLVLCTANARRQWKEEIEKYYRNPKGVAAIIDSKKKAENILERTEKYLIVGYPTLSRNLQHLLKNNFKGLVWDECHYSKNATAQLGSNRGKATVELIRHLPLETVLALSATPWENHPSEMAPVAWALRPDLFPNGPEDFIAARPDDPRFLRELMSGQVLELRLEEVVDLPKITPNPWEDLFGARMIQMTEPQRKMYEIIRDNGEALKASQKVQRLLLACTHPHKLEDLYEWPEEFSKDDIFKQPRLSAKLEWLREMVPKELDQGAKIVIATGIFATGITRPVDVENDEEFWVGDQLRKWFGKDEVMMLDGHTSKKKDASGSSECDRMIHEWRTNPDIKILVISIPAFPDSINLSVGAIPGITKLCITTLSYPWVPWLQFGKGRFWRKGCGVPVEIFVPVLEDSIDQSLLEMVQAKWDLQLLYRARVPLTEKEYEFLQKRVNIRQLADEARSDGKKLSQLMTSARGRGEEGAKTFLDSSYGLVTNGETLARSFVKMQDHSASGYIANFMRPTITNLLKQGFIHAEGILDAGCGPLTCERKFDIPVYGVDMNHWMVELGKEISPHAGKNAHVGYISELSSEWKNKFELVISSMALDWTSIKKKKGQLSVRDAVMQKLVDVCHPAGRVWWLFSEKCFDQETFEEWQSQLSEQGFLIVPSITGMVASKDHRKKPFKFWSLCFAPMGKDFETGRKYSFCFEKDRIKYKQGGKKKKSEPKEEQVKESLHAFSIEHLDESVDFRDAADELIEAELQRFSEVKEEELHGWKFHKSPDIPWRTLQILQEKGLLSGMF